MYKLLVLVMFSMLWMLLHVKQVDEQMAMRLLFTAKQAVNRAAHAAAQQLEEEALSEGYLVISEEEARGAAERYLRLNLALDEQGYPAGPSIIGDRVELLEFHVVNEGNGVSFPYRYVNPDYGYDVTLQKPGVIMIVRVRYKRTFTVIEPIQWEIKGAAELVSRV